MRPIDRGPAPRAYAEYGDAIDDLVDRLGRYSSYCERRLPTNLAVEHMSPKSTNEALILDWNNFLLGCVNCNSVKGDNDVAEGDVLWPDQHNTMRAIDYSAGGFVRVVEDLDDELNQRATGLLDLVGLDRHFADGYPEPTPRDLRWEQREEAWATAEKCRADLAELGESGPAIQLVLAVAKYCGFFSVWMTVFHEFVEVRRALVDEFPGTAGTCFDQHRNFVRRPHSPI